MKCFIYVKVYVVQTAKFDIILTFHIHISHIDNTTDFYLCSALAMKICGCIVFSDLYRQKEDCSSALLNKLHIYMKISTVLYLMLYSSVQQISFYL